MLNSTVAMAPPMDYRPYVSLIAYHGTRINVTTVVVVLAKVGGMVIQVP